MKHTMTFKHQQQKEIISFAAVVFLLLLLVASCQSPNSPVIDGTTGGGQQNQNSVVTINGTVIDSVTQIAVDSAIVRINYGTEIVTLTDAYGKFAASFTLDAADTVTISVIKFGYTLTVSSAIYSPGDNKTPTIKLKSNSNSSGKSGPPVAIYLVSQSSLSLGVKESGALESGKITFQVIDSLGKTIDFANSVAVKFTIGYGPNGGEFLSPDSSYTDANGQASVFLTSGTKAGTVQIIANILVGSKQVSSIPVTYAIHGGLPDQTHFSTGPQYVNIPGLVVYGVTDKITAYVGDKYANPARPNTPVYFTTTGGIIVGSSNTDDHGRATVDLISAAPEPIDAILGPGFARITATSSDENFNLVTYTIPILFSGSPFINCVPSTFDIPNRGTEFFNYEVKDQYNNPLSNGQTITVVVDGDNVKGRGDVSMNLPDTQSRGWTQFSFSITDSDTLEVPRSVSVSIKTGGPNGGNHYSFSGIVR